MWIDKAAEKTFGRNFYLFEEFLDAEAYNNIKIIGKTKVGDTEVYEVTATQYVKDVERTFYFGDFSVMTDLMDYPGYVRKNSDVVNDMKWALHLYSRLSKEDAREYKKQFKEYHKKQMQEDKDMLKTL